MTVAPPSLGPGFDPIPASARLSETSYIGDPSREPLEIDTRPGEWFAYHWALRHTPDDLIYLVAIHADFVRNWREIVSAAEPIGAGWTEGATALFFDPVIADDEAAFDEIGNPVVPGLISNRGFVLHIYGDGGFPVRATGRDGRAVCVVLSDSDNPLAWSLLCGADRTKACLAEMARWREMVEEGEEPDEDSDDDIDDLVLLAMRTLDGVGPDAVEELERVFDCAVESDDVGEDVAHCAASELACHASDGPSWFEWLLDAFESEEDGEPRWGLRFAVAGVLRSRHDAEMERLLAERLRRSNEPWSHGETRALLLEAAAAGGYRSIAAK
jgi:hypothetical protein